MSVGLGQLPLTHAPLPSLIQRVILVAFGRVNADGLTGDGIIHRHIDLHQEGLPPRLEEAVEVVGPQCRRVDQVGAEDYVHAGRRDAGTLLQAGQVDARSFAAHHSVRAGRDRGLVDDAVVPPGVDPLRPAPRLREDVVDVGS
jgi:hypothetical protein